MTLVLRCWRLGS